MNILYRKILLWMFIFGQATFTRQRQLSDKSKSENTNNDSISTNNNTKFLLDEQKDYPTFHPLFNISNSITRKEDELEKDLRKVDFGRKLKSNKINQIDITNAIDYGIKQLKELIEIKEPEFYKLGLFLNDNEPAAKVANFGAPTNPKATLMSRIGFATLEASEKIAQTFNKNIGPHNTGIPADLQAKINNDECPVRGHPKCSQFSRKFRTSDGTCNNLQHPWRGSAMLPMQRLLPPVYDDGIQSVRRSIFGQKLASPREISTTIHRDQNREIQSVTLMFMQWGQFIDHDITSTLKSRGFNGTIPRCCQEDGSDVLPPEFLHPSCLPIDVPRSDPFLGRFRVGCMEFLRSAPSTRIDCELGWREQINQVTSYLDASTIYGSDSVTSESIRTFQNGQIFYGKPSSQNFPSHIPDENVCKSGALSEDCLLPGDNRFSENPGLVALHTVFVRYHNKIATVLSRINRRWSEEKVFQETRKIVYSVIQHITYKEYLPIVLGPEVMDLFELRLVKDGYYTRYDPNINPAIANAFSTAAFRFGHSMVQNSFVRTDSHHNHLPNNVSLHNEISNVENIWSVGSIDRFLLGMINQPSQKRDEFIADELTNHLFQFSDAIPFGMDLAAINIQRGRDHGIPPYTFWRKPCGLSPINNWQDLEQAIGLSAILKLRTLYSHVNDIDLFTAGLAEKPLKGAVLGPTFACIIAQQFHNLRKGDRFWYENDGFESSFSSLQLRQIRKTSLAQVICQTMDEIESVQPFVFLSADNFRNVRVSCDSPEIRNFDLAPWIENTFEFGNDIGGNDDSFESERVLNEEKNRSKRDVNIKITKRRDDTKTRLTNNKTANLTTKLKYNNVPNRAILSRAKPNYYQVINNNDDITYLFGIVPESTTKRNIDQPLQLNINIQINTATVPNKILQHTMALTNNDYNSGTNKPTATYYNKNTVILTTKRPTSTTTYPQNDRYSTYYNFFDNMMYATTNGHKRPNVKLTTNKPLNSYYNTRPTNEHYYSQNYYNPTHFENRPFSTSNYDQDKYVYNKDEDILDGFFDRQEEFNNKGINDKLDFESRLIDKERNNKSLDKISGDKKIEGNSILGLN